MVTLKTHCSDETNAQFHGLAAGSDLSEAICWGLWARQWSSRVAKSQLRRSSRILPVGEGHGGRLMLRLHPTEVQAIRSLAEPEGYSTQAWIIRQLRHRLEDAMPFSKEELDALRDAVRELAVLGRNLNTLLHVLHRSDRFEEGRLDLQALHAASTKGAEQLVEVAALAMPRVAYPFHCPGACNSPSRSAS